MYTHQMTALFCVKRCHGCHLEKYEVISEIRLHVIDAYLVLKNNFCQISPDLI